MSIVEYLLDEAHADPLVKNSFGEAAYDVSAAAGESYICEMLQKAGTKWWQMQYIEQGTDPMVVSQRSSNYDLLDFHVTVMVVLHENQRATSILGLSKPQFSATALTKYDVKGPWSLHPSGLSCSKEEVRLPPSNVGRSPGGSNWFWLTDWQIDYSDPRIDPTSGWQYARSFDTADNAWTPVAPTRRMDLAKTNTTLPNDTDHPENESQGDYLYYAEEIMQATKRELSASTEDAGQPIRHTIRQLTKELRSYEEAVQMLLAGIKTDYNQFRKHQASILVTSYSEHIDKLNAQITELAPKLSTPISPAPLQHNEELARELGFVQSSDNRLARDSAVYNNEPSAAIGSDFDANPWSRLGSNTNTHSQSVEPWQASTSVLQHDTSGLHAVDLLGHNDPMDEFTSPLSTQQATQSQGPRPFAWEADLEAKECRRCSRRFGLLVRRHHCRRCGLIVCDKCSSSRAYLAPSEILQDPASPLESVQVLASQHQRVCDKCYADLGMSS
ncbi:FYVE zinc finger-domain-containing protein [Radiomyces spectabilis]|uniref:FYVE zinc finger-domain-containing protein n=1 Tax=Radiomyces spectabilis TaxID=64574 RepID=UPI002220B427|nr:FYVE zinc finger-domain-containing protein [Radiomyces spectabilis]KAI8366679.1 FYVE zinc finger-domain-containing protein [Radiomyces spectabilis]